MKLWSNRYLIIANVIGLNLGYVAYHTLFWNLYLVAWIPLSFLVFFFARNYVLSRSIDRVYFPLESIFKTYWKREKSTSEVKESPEINKVVEKQEKSELDKAVEKTKKDAKNTEENWKKVQSEHKEILDEFYDGYLNEDHFDTLTEF